MKARVGKPALPFELKDTTGEIHRLDDDAGHWLLLIFHRHLG
jgi:peroxiredoxin